MQRKLYEAFIMTDSWVLPWSRFTVAILTSSFGDSMMKALGGVSFCLSPGVPIVLSYLQPFQLSRGPRLEGILPKRSSWRSKLTTLGRKRPFQDIRVWKRRAGEFSKTLLIVAATCVSIHLGKRSSSKIITKSVEKCALLSV